VTGMIGLERAVRCGEGGHTISRILSVISYQLTIS